MTPNLKEIVMPEYENHRAALQTHCCPCAHHDDQASDEVSGHSLPGVAGLGGMVVTGLTWSALAAAGPGLPRASQRRPLVVKPIFTYPLASRRQQTSWRNWGGIQTPEDVEAEAARIRGELDKLKAAADFPLNVLPLAQIRTVDQLAKVDDVGKADVLLLYAAGDGGGDLMASINPIAALGKDTIIFARHQSGPVYYWYEGMMARFLHQHTDELAVTGIDYTDVVIDSQDEVLWRLRALCGLRNTIGSRILAVGGPGGWCTPAAPALAKDRFKLDIQSVSYSDLGELIKAARADAAAVRRARNRAEEYLKVPGTTLDTRREFVDNAFLLEEIFRKLMQKADCRTMTINSCMTVIMPLSETTACLPLSTLNDDGYMAFCESDFVVIPSGILLGNISNRPPFLNDPTYPHDGVITLAHCTGPRKMDGKTPEPARIMTHFESDYGAAPKVDMSIGRKVTMIAPDFAAKRWMGLAGQIVDHPLLPICRCQIDVSFQAPSELVAARMPGFHWMLVYGDYAREVGYALRKVGIQWDYLG
jgi:hypothetical protein